MNLHHSPSLFLSQPYTHIPKMLLCLQCVFCICSFKPIILHTCVFCLSIHSLLHLTIHPLSRHLQRGGKVIYSSFQDTESSSLSYSTPTLFCSFHPCETGAWVLISSTCRRLVRSEMACSVQTYICDIKSLQDHHNTAHCCSPPHKYCEARKHFHTLYSMWLETFVYKESNKPYV